MTRRELAKEVKALIAVDKLKDAIDLLLTFIDDNQIIVQSSNYHHIANEVRQGTMSWDDSKLEKNRIKYIMLEIVDEISSNSNSVRKQENIISLLLSLGYRVTENKKFMIVGFLVSSFFILGESKIKQLLYLLGLAFMVIAGFNIYFMMDSNNKSVEITNNRKVFDSINSGLSQVNDKSKTLDAINSELREVNEKSKTLDSINLKLRQINNRNRALISLDSELREIVFFCDYPNFDSIFFTRMDELSSSDISRIGRRSLYNYDLSRAKLEDKNFSFTSFREVDFRNSSFRNSNFRNSSFIDCNLAKCNFSNAFLCNSSRYQGSDLTGVILLNSKTYEKNWINNLLFMENVSNGANEIERKYYVDTLNPIVEYSWLDNEFYYLIKEK